MLTQTPQKRELFASTLNKVLLGVFAVVLISVIWLGVRPQSAHAFGVGGNSTLNFQARLESSNGAIAPDGNYNVEFKLYDASTGGTNLWTEDYTFTSGSGGTDARVRVANGYLSVNLGSITPFPNTINWDQQLYLTMNIGGTSNTVQGPSSTYPTGWDGEMSPRLPLTAVPYAFQAQSAAQLQDLQGSNTGTLSFNTLSANQNILLPNASGTVALTNDSTDFIRNQTSLQTANFNIQSAAAGSVGATIQGASGQTADLLQVLSPGGTANFRIDKNDNVHMAGQYFELSPTSGATGQISNATLTVNTLASGYIGLGIRGQSAQTSDLLQLQNASSNVLGGFNSQGNLYYQSGSYAVTLTTAAQANNVTLTIPADTNTTDTICVVSLNNCTGAGATTVGILDGGTANANGATISAGTLYLQSASASFAGLVNITNQTFAGNKTFSGTTTLNNTTLTAGSSITLTGGNTASRPASPTEGMLYYDTTTHSLLVYSNGKWQADRTTATKIVAMGTATGCSGSVPVASSNPDAADFVSTSCTSSQTTINAAISALPAGGGTVYLMEGTYIVDGPITPKANVTIVGSGPSTILKLKNATNANVSVIDNSAVTFGTNGPITVSNLLIDGNKTNNTSGSEYGIGFTTSTATNPLTISGVTIQNTRSGGVYIRYGTSSTYITSSTVTSNGGFGVALYQSNNSISNNTITNNTGDGLYLSAAYYSKTDNNYIAGNSGWGINTMIPQYNTFSNNTLYNNTSGGIELYGANYSTASANNILSNGGAGIAVQQSNSLSITGNYIGSNATQGIFYTINQVSDNLVSGNTLVGNGGSGTYNSIDVSGSYVNLRIIGNTITTSATGYGIYTDSFYGPTGVYISGNTYSGPGTAVRPGIKGTVYANQSDGNGNIINSGQGAFTVGTNTVSSTLSIQGGVTATALSAPAAPTLATAGTAGSTSYSYVVTALDGIGETLGSTATTIATGNATLSGTNYIKVTFAPVSGAVSYKVYRTASGGSPATTGYIGTVTSTGASSYTFNDTGLAASGSTPAANTTGGGTFAGVLQGSSGAFTSGNLTLGTTGSATGNISLKGSTASSGTVNITLASNNPNNVTLQLYNSAAGTYTICTSDINSCGGTTGAYITLQGTTPGTAQNGNFNISGTGIANVLEGVSLYGGTTGQFYVDSSGDFSTSGTGNIKNTSTSAFQIQNNAGVSTLLTADTSNMRVSVGNIGTSTGQLYVSGSVPSGASGSVSTGSGPYGLAVQGHYAYVANYTANTLQVFDIGNPASPVSVGSVATGSAPENVVVQGHYAYVVNYSANTFQVFDISNPTSPTSVGSVSTGSGSQPGYVVVQGRYAYVATRFNGLLVYDISTPSAPVQVGSLSTANIASYSIVSLFVQGNYLYRVENYAGTLQVINIANPASPTSVSTVSTGSSVVAVTVQGRYAYLIGSSTLKVYDVSNPASPTSVGSVATGTTPAGITVQGRYVYVVNATSGTLQLFDVSNPASPASLGTVATGNTPESVVVQGRYAYVVNNVSNTLTTYNLGGAYIQQLETGGAEFGSLSVDGNTGIAGDASVQGGVNIGQSLQVGGSAGLGGSLNAGGTITATGFVGTSLDTGTVTTLNIGATNANVINVGGTNYSTVNIGAVGTGAANTGIYIGTSTGATYQQNVAIGSNANAGSTTTVNGYALTLQSANNLTITATAAAATITVGAVNQTGAITLGQATSGANTINVGNGATTGTQTIYIGTGATGAGTDMVTIGSTLNGSITTIQGGTGNINLYTNNTGSGVVVKSGTNSTAAFVIQNSTSNALFNADTTTGIITIGDIAGGNDITISSTGIAAYGTARHVKILTFEPEFAGAVLDAQNDSTCTSANNGTMTSGFDGVKSYYNWTSTQTSAQCYDVVLRVPMPSDFGAWDTATTGTVLNINGYTTDTTNGTLSVQVLNPDGSVRTAWASVPLSTPSTWTTVHQASGVISWTSGQVFTLQFRMSAANAANIRLGTVQLYYYTAY